MGTHLGHGGECCGGYSPWSCMVGTHLGGGGGYVDGYSPWSWWLSM